MAFKNKTWKYVNIVLLILIALGFTLPGVLYFGGSSEDGNVVNSNQRICRTDADCYLNCEEGLKSVLCEQNLCSINSCNEENSYEFDMIGHEIELEINVNGEEVNLLNNTLEGDFFVQFSNDGKVKIFSDSLSLNQILTKTSMILNNNCLLISTESYCIDDKHELHFFVNDEEKYSFGSYVPEAGDEIKIVYE